MRSAIGRAQRVELGFGVLRVVILRCGGRDGRNGVTQRNEMREMRIIETNGVEAVRYIGPGYLAGLCCEWGHALLEPGTDTGSWWVPLRFT